MGGGDIAMIVGVIKESFPGERRVALVPGVLAQLRRAGPEVLIEPGAGAAAGFPDEAYTAKGATIAASRAEVFDKADVIVQVRSGGANPDGWPADLAALKPGKVVIGACDPLVSHDANQQSAAKGITLFSMEMMPRITRAQSMDILSSMATIAGYKAVILAADNLPQMFPMMMTAAGTVSPAKVFIIGAGVAGLQAIATARKLGGIVEAYDVRPAVKEQVLSLGAKFVEMELETSAAEDAGGYAKALGEDFYRKQRELMTTVIAGSDVVITTAAVPGKKAPILVTTQMVEGMHSGAVVVDLAAERGGNCELTQPGEIVVHKGVTILGPLNIPSAIPFHASQMYAKNIVTFLLHLIKEGNLKLDLEDEITAGTLVTNEGKVVHPMVLAAMGEGGQTS
jgi:NAD(P) transhydrogenase subunit alpha